MGYNSLEYGYGYGNGYGNGYGYGNGNGYGYGDGKSDSQNNKNYFDLIIESHRARCDIPSVKIVFWRSKKDGTPSNGGSKTVAKVGLTEEVKGPLKLCSQNALHGTLNPEKWQGEKWWVVALHEPVGEEEHKYGSLKRTIIADLGNCPF